VDARAKARLGVARQALLALRHRDFRSVVSGKSAAGDHVIIPMLEDDTMGQFLDQFRAACGPVYVVAPDADQIAILSVTPTHIPRHAAKPSDEPCPIYRTTEVGMVISLLKECGGPVSFYEAPTNVLVRLVDDGVSVV